MFACGYVFGLGGFCSPLNLALQFYAFTFPFILSLQIAPKDDEKGVLLLMGLGAGLGSVLVVSLAVPLIFLCRRRMRGENGEGRP